MDARAIVVVLALVTGGPAAAQDAAALDFGRTGPYAIVGVAVGFPDFDSIPNGIIEPAAGLSMLGGYRFHPHIAGELQLEWLGSDFQTESGASTNAEITPITTTVNLKAFLTKNVVQPYGFVGIGVLHVTGDQDGRSISETGFAARFGAGMDVYFNEHFGLSMGLSYVLPTGDVEDVPYLVVDAMRLHYRF